jgi:hypothetical protein
MSTIAPLSTSTAPLAQAATASPTETTASAQTAQKSTTTVDTRDTVSLSAEAQAILDKSGGGKGEVSFVDSVRKLTDGAKAQRTELQGAAEELRSEARGAGESPGEAMNEKTGSQRHRSLAAAGRRVRTLVRR